MESPGPGTVTQTPRPPKPAAAGPFGPKRRWLYGLGAVGLSLFAAEAVRVIVGSNLHEVLPGQVFRSAQPTPALLEWLARERGLRTVINLRGAGEGQDWYDREADACQRLGLSLENVTLTATRLPSCRELQRLLELLDRAERPLLVHCRRGADRTGLTSAMVLLTQTDLPYARARAALSLRAGHWRWGAAGVMDVVLSRYETWLRECGVAHTPDAFRRWIREGYGATLYRHEVVACRPMQAEARVGRPLGYRVTFRNPGPRPWPMRAIGRTGVHLAFRMHQSGTTWLYEARGGFQDTTVGPGEEIELTVAVPPLAAAGRYRLRVDLVEEGHAWFHQFGGEPWDEELTVRE